MTCSYSPTGYIDTCRKSVFITNLQDVKFFEKRRIYEAGYINRIIDDAFILDTSPNIITFISFIRQLKVKLFSHGPLIHFEIFRLFIHEY